MLDLHMHTTYSDGLSDPTDLVQAIVAKNLKAIAVTDHDTTESYTQVCQAAAGSALEIIPGIEINTHYEHVEIHVLGYFIDPEDAGLQAVCQKHRTARLVQIEEISKRLQAAGVPVSFDDILARSRPNGSLGRPHVAQAIVAKKAAKDIGEAFNKYLNTQANTFCRRETVSPHEAVEAIYESGGIAVIAHPGDMPIIPNLVPELMSYGLRGLEAYHKSHSPGIVEFNCTLAEKLGLIVTGGTDFHGQSTAYSNAFSRLKMPAGHILETLKTERDRRMQSISKTVWVYNSP